MPPPVFFTFPVFNYLMLYSTLRCNKMARWPVGVKNISQQSRGTKQNRSENFSSLGQINLVESHLLFFVKLLLKLSHLNQIFTSNASRIKSVSSYISAGNFNKKSYLNKPIHIILIKKSALVFY